MHRRAFLLAAFVVFALAAPARAGSWRAPAFSLRDLAGTSHSLASYRGKVVVLEFFASWCPTCRSSVRSLNGLAQRYPGKVEVVAVATDEDDPHDLPAFVEEYAPVYTILVDDADLVGGKYRVMGFPTYFIIDAKGMVRANHEGAVEWDDPRNRQKLESLFDGLAPAEPAAAPLPVTTVSIGPDRR